MATNKNIKINLDYSDFSGGISECNRKMGLLNETFKLQSAQLGNNASEVDRLSLTESKLTQQIQLQEQVWQAAADRVKAVSEAENSTTAQVEKAHLAMVKQATKLQELRNELEGVRDKLEETANAENTLDGNTTNATTSLSTMVANVTTAIGEVTSFISVCQQAGQALREMAEESTQFADNLQTLSSQTGISTTTLQELAYASDFVDVSLETMQSSMSKMTKLMGDAQSGSQSAQQAFDRLGISITNTNGSLKSSEQVFYEVIDALGEINNQAQRDSTAMSVFGKSAQDLNSLIEQGSGALRSYGEEANNLGIVMSQKDVAALSEMQNSFDRLDSAMEASSRRVSATIAPAFSEVADVIANLNPEILDLGTVIGKMLGVAGQVAPVFSSISQMMNTAAIAKNTMAFASMTASTGETALAGSAMAANMALLPQVIAVGGLVIAIGFLVYEVMSLVDAYKQLKEAAEAAGASTQDVMNIMSDVVFGTNKSGVVNTGHKALGGPAGGRVWVGEQGAELVDLPYGSTVYNHEESSQMTSANNVFNVTIDAKNVDDFNKVVNVFSGLSQSMSRGGKVNG